MPHLSIRHKVWLLVFLVLLLDQCVKIYIKTHMVLGQEFSVIGDWFIIRFIENNGMAFGFELGGNIGKLILSICRIGAVFAIGWYIHYLIKQKVHQSFILTCSLIFAGAIGNILDCMFYGLIFDSSSYIQVATAFPEGGGYAGFLQGKVVDMLYFPLFEGTFPSWIPGIGGNDFLFFRPIFNVADSAITIGIFIILLFQRSFFTNELQKEKPKS